MIGRSMYIWKLAPVLAAEGGIVSDLRQSRRLEKG